ncbi:pentapeptide repeat-containing protein [Streptomyces hokutonensis]|uniref:Pentapeptide repeat-containing protein n=1 Tax=Streptomyces hokutonensis TaxID=1306990 RepID=A0ABW6M6Q9_9ACTN
MTAGSAQPRKYRVLLGVVTGLGIAALAAVIIALFWRGPEWVDGINPDHLGKNDGPKATVVAGLRTALATCLVGIAALVGLYFTRATYQQNRAKDQEQFALAQKQFELTQEAQQTSRTESQEQFALAQKQFELAQETQRQNRISDEERSELAREGQITERYIKAVTLLADEDEGALTARLAGIYALERIMGDSQKDHETIVKLLAAFIRRHAKITSEYGEPVRDDVQAALTVLAQRPDRPESFVIDLSHTDLRDAELATARLEQTNFAHSKLNGASLTGAHLSKANFWKAQLKEAVADGADFRSAHLLETEMWTLDGTGADFRAAYMRQADLRGANLQDAKFDGADLTEARFIAEDGTRIAIVDTEQLLVATVSQGTLLHPSIKDDPVMAAHIRECDKDFFGPNP